MRRTPFHRISFKSPVLLIGCKKMEVFKVKVSLDNCDLTSLMNTYQTRRQIPDCLCLNQPAGHIPPGAAHVSRGFSA